MSKINDKIKILIADDDESVLYAMETILLETADYDLHAVKTGQAALDALRSHTFDVALLDLKLPDFDGLEIIKKAKDAGVSTEIVMITGHASIDTAVSAIRLGAYDYLPKPVNSNDLIRVVEHAVERSTLKRQNEQLQSQVESLTRYNDIIGKTEKMQALFQTLEAVSSSEASVLILGESGTGKELVAHAIHQRSNRNDGPFVAVNCAALPATILESELFGHEKGAFTGAVKDKTGLFSQADSGTIFLDEIAEMPFELQAKLLRVLETGVFRSVGGQKETSVDVRILAATNQDPQEAVANKHLREDLYYRIAVIEVELPALRDRMADIPLLANDFLTKFSKAAGKDIEGFSPETLECLLNYDWPGNVRELRNAVERAVILCRESIVTAQNLPPRLNQAGLPEKIDLQSNQRGEVVVLPSGMPLASVEKKIILDTLKNCNNNKTRAAKILNISLKTLHNKLARYKEMADE
ncbi:MAG: sigma-54-dependent Fis family transcriptional regulator [Calditrichaeota bacterium]|nr:MAG: sigma-54-dependent Fis family transcriptional regulator [Calditrichota bacterium]